MDNRMRTEAHKRLKPLEQLLEKVNCLLEEPELGAISKFTKPVLPAVFIVGNPRSGSTLLYQWLAASGLFAYPSNIMSRFYKAPYVGGLIHKIFVEHDKHGELCGNGQIEFTSQLGKTRGAYSPHEFWYFWRRFFRFEETQGMHTKVLSKTDRELFLKELAAIERCFEKPLLLKALIMNWHIDLLNDLIDKPLFIHIKRDELHNMASLFRARKEFFNDPSRWYSFKPPEYRSLKSKSLYMQLAGQVCFTNQHIERSLQNIAPERSITISYEKMCGAPEKYYDQILSRLNLLGYETKTSYGGPAAFEPSLAINDEFDFARADEALASISGSERRAI